MGELTGLMAGGSELEELTHELEAAGTESSRAGEGRPRVRAGGRRAARRRVERAADLVFDNFDTRRDSTPTWGSPSTRTCSGPPPWPSCQGWWPTWAMSTSSCRHGRTSSRSSSCRADKTTINTFQKALAIMASRSLLGAAAVQVVGAGREDERQAAVRYWKRAIQIAVDLDCGSWARSSTAGPRRRRPRRPGSGARWRSCCRSSSVRACSCAWSRDDFIEDSRAAIEMVRGVDNELVSFLYCAPTFHQGGDLEGIMRYAVPLLTHLHIADSFDHTGSSGLRLHPQPAGHPGPHPPAYRTSARTRSTGTCSLPPGRPRLRHRHRLRVRLGGAGRRLLPPQPRAGPALRGQAPPAVGRDAMSRAGAHENRWMEGRASDQHPDRLRLGAAPTPGASGSPTTRARRPGTGSWTSWPRPATTWLELGPYGYLPTDPGWLRDEVDRRGLRVSGPGRVRRPPRPRQVGGRPARRPPGGRAGHRHERQVTWSCSRPTRAEARRKLDPTGGGPWWSGPASWGRSSDEHGLAAVFHRTPTATSAHPAPDRAVPGRDRPGRRQPVPGHRRRLLRRQQRRAHQPLPRPHRLPAPEAGRPGRARAGQGRGLGFGEAVQRGAMCEPPKASPTWRRCWMPSTPTSTASCSRSWSRTCTRATRTTRCRSPPGPLPTYGSWALGVMRNEHGGRIRDLGG